MDSQDQQKKQDPSKSTNGGTERFDREIRDILKDAVLTPPPDFFKSIEEALVESPTEPKQVAMPNTEQNAPETQVIDKKIFFLKRFRRRWGYAASISILILLSLGFWKFNLFSGKEKPITAILNPHTLLSEKLGSQEEAKERERPGTSDKAAHQNTTPSDLSVSEESVKQKTVGAASREKNKSNNTAMDPVARKTVVLSADGKRPAELAPAKGIAAEITVAAVQSKELAPVILPGKSIPPAEKQTVNSGTIGMNQPVQPPSKQVSLDNHPEIPTVASEDIKEANSRGAIAVNRNSRRNDQLKDGPSNGLDDGQAVDRQHERSGLFRGLVNHFKERVDEISNEVVMEDQQKTRIKVGCIAITTYK